MITATTKSVDDTRELASQVATVAVPGDVVLLSGDLGAGKTAFVQGFGRGLGVTDPITSPTFTIIRSHPGRVILHHVDAYRLDRLEEVVDLGLSELADEAGVAIIEWGDVFAPTLPADYLQVRIELGDGDDDRRIELRAIGPSWPARLPALARALERWTNEAA